MNGRPHYVQREYSRVDARDVASVSSTDTIKNHNIRAIGHAGNRF